MARIKNEFDFISGVHLDGELHFNKFTLNVSMYTVSDEPSDQNIGYERLTYFIEELVSKCVFVSEDDPNQITAYANAGMLVLTVPSPGPYDPIVQAVLVHKMNMILEDSLIIDHAEITSIIGGLVTYVWDETEDDDVHDIVTTDDDTKWWATSDYRFVSYPEDFDIEDYEEKNPPQFSWEDFDLGWEQEEEEEDEEDGSEPTTSGTIIKISDFNKGKKKK